MIGEDSDDEDMTKTVKHLFGKKEESESEEEAEVIKSYLTEKEKKNLEPTSPRSTSLMLPGPLQRGY